MFYREVFFRKVASLKPYANLFLRTEYKPPPPSHFIVLNLIARIILTREYDLLRSSLCSIFHSPAASRDITSNFFLSLPETESLKLYSSFNVEDQVSHSYKITGEGQLAQIFKHLIETLEK
jgi:hypothetical protein